MLCYYNDYMGAKEEKLTNEHLSNLGDHQRRFRINCGIGWVGKEVRGENIFKYISRFGTKKCILLVNHRPLHAAPEGWPDLAGWDMIEITPDMVGQKIAVFAGDEIKATGGLSRVQKMFRDCLVSMGGRFRVVRPE